MSAKGRLLLSIGILISFIIITISTFNYTQISNYSINNYKGNLSNTTYLITKAIEQKSSTYFVVLETLANSIPVIDGKMSPDDKVLSEIKKANKALKTSNVFIGFVDGSIFDSDSNGYNTTLNAKALKREWYKKSITGIPRVVTTPFMASTGQMSISLSVPLMNKGEVIGIVGLSLQVNELTDFINDLALNNNVYVAREDGFLMAAPEKEMVGNNLFELRPSYQKYASRNKSEHNYTVAGKGDFYVVSYKSPKLGWTVWDFASWDTINRVSNESVVTNTLVGIFFIVVGIGGALFLIQKLMYNPIGGEPKVIELLVKKVASGDLTNLPEADSKSIGVYRSTLLMTENLKSIIRDINNSTTEINVSSDKLKNSSVSVDESSKTQMMQLEQVATAMNEMTATITEVAHNAVEASNSSNDANICSQNGLDIVGQMNTDISKLVDDIVHVQHSIRNVHEHTENVSGILDVINNIAAQTNLLALNAAIEAARAGEHGRGFAVVADEVRALAIKTHESTNEIQAMIALLQDNVNESVALMEENASSAYRTLDMSDKANQAIMDIRCEIQMIQDMNHQIATAAEEQSQVASEINESVVLVNELSKKTSLDVKDNVVTTEILSRMSGELNKSVGKFKL